MNIYLKEACYIKSADGIEHIVRANTLGVNRNGVVYFYDTTKTTSFGVSKDFCIENPNMFRVQREITDREISARDAVRMVREFVQPLLEPVIVEDLIEKIESL